MNKHIFYHLFWIAGLAWLAAACTGAPRTSPTPVPQTATARPPIRTPLPTVLQTATASPTSQPVIEPVMIQPCAEDGTGDTRAFNELLESLTATLYEMDSYHYRTLYRYSEGDRYANEELSVEVEGAHNGLLTSPAESFFYPFGSQSYERSNVILTDLRSGSRTETIVTEDGFWVRQADDPGWVAFDPATPADLSNLAEMFSPQVVAFMIGGGGSLKPGVQAEAPAMVRAETLDGREVNHRCWFLPAYEDSDINAYLIHGESLYTFLSDAEVHLWTTPDDKQLVRLAITGKHIGERLGEEEGLDHDTARDFLLWMEILDVDTPIDIMPPPADQIALTIPAQKNPAADISAPYNDLPVPAGAVKVGTFDESDPPIPIPREYKWPHYTIMNEGVLDANLGSGWYKTTADRRPMYEAEITLPETAAFYLDEMGRRDWQLKEKFFQAGWPVLYLFFERDGVTLPVIIETKQAGTTRISAILPPSDDNLEASLSGWISYSTQNSDLSGDSVNAIAFDPQGKTWIGTASGLNAFDGEAWTAYPAEDLDLAAEGPDYAVNALAVDGQGRVWVGTANGLVIFDGKTWKTYTSQNSKLPSDYIQEMAVDQGGRVWLAPYGVSVFDGKKFTNYDPAEIGLPDGHSVKAIACDPQDRIWIATDGGGVYMFDGKAWKPVLKAKSPPHTTYTNYAIQDLAIDQQGQVWIGTGEGLSVFNGKDWITYTPENSGMPFQGVEALAVDAYDRLWVGGNYGAVSVLETDGTWNDYTPVQDAAAGYSTNTSVVDPQGRIWVGTDKGLNVFTPPMPASTVARVLPNPTPLPPTPTPMPTPGPGWTTYTTENSGLINNEVYAVAIDGQDRVWAGTSGGVSVFSPAGEWTSYQMANSELLANHIQSLAIDGQGRVWMGAGSSGLTVLAPDGTWKMYTPDNSDLPCEDVDGLMVDGQDRVWISFSTYSNCSQEALSVLAPNGKWTTYTTENSGLAIYWINDLALDKQGRVWIGTYDGVSVLAPNGQWTNYTDADLGLTGDPVWVSALGVDEQGQVWIGSSGSGLVVLAPDGSRTAYTTQNSSLASDDISALLIDDVGRVWVGTGAGLGVLTPDGRWESYTYENTDLIQGTISSLAMDSQGRLWIGTDAGLGVIDPKAP